MKAFIIKVYTAEVNNKFQNIFDDNLKLISHQELYLNDNTPRQIQQLMSSLARYINDKRKD